MKNGYAATELSVQHKLYIIVNKCRINCGFVNGVLHIRCIYVVFSLPMQFHHYFHSCISIRTQKNTNKHIYKNYIIRLTKIVFNLTRPFPAKVAVKKQFVK